MYFYHPNILARILSSDVKPLKNTRYSSSSDVELILIIKTVHNIQSMKNINSVKVIQNIHDFGLIDLYQRRHWTYLSWKANEILIWMSSFSVDLPEEHYNVKSSNYLYRLHNYQVDIQYSSIIWAPQRIPVSCFLEIYLNLSISALVAILFQSRVVPLY